MPRLTAVARSRNFVTARKPTSMLDRFLLAKLVEVSYRKAFRLALPRIGQDTRHNHVGLSVGRTRRRVMSGFASVGHTRLLFWKEAHEAYYALRGYSRTAAYSKLIANVHDVFAMSCHVC